MGKNIFKEYAWERDGNGNYVVTSLLTGKSVIAIHRLEDRNKFCIRGSEETVKNHFGQTIPKRYNKFEVMEYLARQ